MKKRRDLLSIIFLVFIFYGIGFTPVKAAWEQKEAGWCYSENAVYKKASWFQDTDGKWYYFDENGYMKTGWFQDKDGKWYYFDASGAMASNTIIDGIYRLGADGAWIEKSGENQNTQNVSPSYTANAIKNKNLSSYTAGTASIYGAELTQSELDEIAEAVAAFMNQLSPDLDTVEKALMAHNYLAAYFAPAPTRTEYGADTAWSALVYRKAQSSGYARAMKALCDAMDVNCVFVSSNDDAHHWNMVEVDGKWYIVDVQEDATSFCFCCFLCGENYYEKLHDGISYDKASYPACSKIGYEILSYYGKHPQSSRTAFLVSSSLSDRYPEASSTEEKNQQAFVIAQKIASEITGDTDLEKVRKAAQIVGTYCSTDTYTMSGTDYRTAYGVFIKGEYSCAGATRALGMVLNCMGYSYEHKNENQYTHQWCILTMDGQIGYADGQIGWAGYGAHPVTSE